jgi:multidrug resistance efflux pump
MLGSGPARGRLAVGLIVMGAAIGAMLLPRVTARDGDEDTVVVRRGKITVVLKESGILKPAQSMTYRSPVPGTELEILELAPEGAWVQEGDLLARLDTSDLSRELERARQAARQTAVDVRVAESERESAADDLYSVEHGEKALEVEETRAALRLSEKKLEVQRAEYNGLKPLLEKGYITADELQRSALALEQSEMETAMSRRKLELLSDRTQPRTRRRAELQVAQHATALENVRQRLTDAERLVQAFQQTIAACSLYARRPGLVVYEESLSAIPRRKIRVGDRVTQTQGLLTIPELDGLLVETSVRELDVHRVRAGQPATIRVDAYPGRQFTGRVVSVGALARSSAERAFEDRRFDLKIEMDGSSRDLRPDMTARVEILVAERTSTLLLPLRSVRAGRAGADVQVLRGRRVETRSVQTGLTSEFDVEILSGLAEGEQVLTPSGQGAQ